MATAGDLQSHVTSAVTCPICLELFNSPKSLPCLHTFCLQCIEGHCRDNEPGDEVACPVCRQKFNIPENGVRGLVSNFLVAGLVDARKTAHDHDRVSAESEMETESTGHSDDEKCEWHPTEREQLFCFDCMVNVCTICFAEEHQDHRHENTVEASAECVRQIDTYLVAIKERADDARRELTHLSKDRRRFLAGVEEVREQIKERGEELKHLIDKHLNELMSGVQQLRTETCKDIESHRENAEAKLLTLETFSTYCGELKSKGKPRDITRAAKSLHTRATELLRAEVSVTDYSAPAITFRSMNIDGLLDNGQNFIGAVKSNSVAEATQSLTPIQFVTRREKTLDQLQLSELSAETERSLRQQRHNREKCVGDGTGSNVKMEDGGSDVTASEDREEELRRCESETKAKLEKSENVTKCLNGQIKRLTKIVNNLKEQLETETLKEKELREQVNQLQDSEQLLKEHIRLACVVDTLPEDDEVVGVTSLDDELYVLRDKPDDQVEVYNITSCSLVRQLSVSGLDDECSLWDMTSCKHYRCLYIADSNNCIHRIKLLNNKNTKTKWSVDDQVSCLAVTPRFNVLVTCRLARKLIEFTTYGKQLRVIDLQPDVVSPWHSVPLSNDRFVVCHGGFCDPIHRVCIVDDKGHVTQSYGGTRGPAAVGELSSPYHLAVDKDEFIYVADGNNGRVLLLSPTLNYVCEIVSSDQLELQAWQLFLDVDRRRLFVADSETNTGGRVVIVQL